MCLIALAWKIHSRHRLVVGANRDEFHARAAAPAGRWADAPAVTAGRDLVAGGTWLGISDAGRFAAVTNVRDGRMPPRMARSRGALTADFLRSNETPLAAAERAHAERAGYGGFNLLLFADDQLAYVSSHGEPPRLLPPGVYALSNAALDTPWPKLARLRQSFGELIAVHPGGDDDELEADIFRLLDDREPAADADLPDTGVGLAVERLLSAPFIVSPEYGTRCSTVVMIDGEARLSERRFDPAGNRVV